MTRLVCTDRTVFCTGARDEAGEHTFVLTRGTAIRQAGTCGPEVRDESDVYLYERFEGNLTFLIQSPSDPRYRLFASRVAGLRFGGGAGFF